MTKIFGDKEIHAFFETITDFLCDKKNEEKKIKFDSMTNYIEQQLGAAVRDGRLKAKCPKCDDTGHVLIEQVNGAYYGFNCNCEAGRTVPQNWPTMKGA